MRKKLTRALLLSAACLFATACGAKKYPLTPDGNAQYLADNKQKPGVVTLPDGLQYRIIARGNGRGNTPTDRGDSLTVSYTGSLVDGTIFDQTKPGETATMDAGDTPPGWLEVLERMQEGDEYELAVPAKLGYGVSGLGKVPPNATLIYRLKLVSMVRVDAEPGEEAPRGN